VPMTILFKFLPTRFAEALTQRGSIRITTLKICRETEAIAGTGRSDAWEGVVLNEFRLGRVIPQPFTAAEIADLRGRGYVTAAEARLRLPGGPYMVRVDILGDYDQSDDKYLFCVSARPRAKLERRFASRDGQPDSWVEIFDWESFCAVLNAHMLSLGHSPYGRRPVEYRSQRFIRRGEAADPVFVKRLLGFSVEHETRIAWTPARLPIDEPLYAELPELTKYCRIAARPYDTGLIRRPR
jgi:hypothetical protein